MNCDVKRCRHDSCIGYYHKHVCWQHWEQHCDDGNSFDLKHEFGIKRKPKKKPIASAAARWRARQKQ